MSDLQISELPLLGDTLLDNDAIAVERNSGGGFESFQANSKDVIKNAAKELELNDFSNVDIVSIKEHDVLSWDGTKFINSFDYLRGTNNLAGVASKSISRGNLDVYSKSESDSKVSAHSNLLNNPHNTTKIHVGLSNVNNWGASSRIDLNSQTTYATSKAVKDAIAEAKAYAANVVGALHPVGSVVLRMDAVNPTTIYGGSWELITGAATLGFGNGAAQNGELSGTNTKAVPLLAHTHTESEHIHEKGTLVVEEGGGHKHTRGNMNIVGSFRIDSEGITHTPPTGAFDRGTNYSFGGDDDGGDSSIINFNAADAWTGETSSNGIHPHGLTGSTALGGSGTTGPAGQASPTINVLGAVININVWKRIA